MRACVMWRSCATLIQLHSLRPSERMKKYICYVSVGSILLFASCLHFSISREGLNKFCQSLDTVGFGQCWKVWGVAVVAQLQMKENIQLAPWVSLMLTRTWKDSRLSAISYLSIAYPFDIYPFYHFFIFLTLWNFSKISFLTPVSSINSLSKAVTLRYGKLSQLEKKMSLFCNFESIVYICGAVE